MSFISERKKRMLVTDDSSDDDDEAPKEDNASVQELRSISGDYPGDSFYDEEPKTKSVWINEILEKENEDDESSEN